MGESWKTKTLWAQKNNMIQADQIQTITNRNLVGGFFASLGYKTDARIEQTPANLGITPQAIADKIRYIERIANQDDYFQVYLFEVDSVIMTLINGLARTFRDFKGHYLLVLTTDYEWLDFVLVETLSPISKDNGKSLAATRKRAFRPLILSVERRKPSRIDLRVIARFEYSAPDPISHYEKLLSAYSVNFWSEEHFNNKGLFSDYYLIERLQETPEWKSDIAQDYRILKEKFEKESLKYAKLNESQLRQLLFTPLFRQLGFEFKQIKTAVDDAHDKPDYELHIPERKSSTTAVLTYRWNRNLDGVDPIRDTDTPNENPGLAVVTILDNSEWDWVIVTNGKIWRLYSRKAHSRATNFYEIDLEEIMALDDPSTAFRYFWLFFDSRAFDKELTDGKTCFLDNLLEGSTDYAKKLGARLKDRVFQQIFPHFATGFINNMGGTDFFVALDEDNRSSKLGSVFQGTLTFLYRLLFLLYAEARDLLPAKEHHGYYQKSLTGLKKEIALKAGKMDSASEASIRGHFKGDSYTLFDHIMGLFVLIDKGDARINLPTYNGGLFVTQPSEDDVTNEARNARFLRDHKIADRDLVLGLDKLARDEDDKKLELVFIDYKSLGVRQLGSIYEGLLEFKVEIAEQKLGIEKKKNKEVYRAWADLSERQKRTCERKKQVVDKGDVYLSNDKRERKATGSYYTPDYIVQYIVEHAVGPVLKSRLESMRPKMRQAQADYHRAVQNNIAKAQAGMKTQDPDVVVCNSHTQVVDDFFRFNVLDPAMGSGHFLVDAVDYITDRMITFLNGFPWNPIISRLRQTRENIMSEMESTGITVDSSRLTDTNLLKRQILKQCIYGVDLNPMAVELAKVSLWLDCFTLGAPLSFLDHHLKCGNSLIGSRIDEVKNEVERDLFGGHFAGLLQATRSMIQVGRLSDVTVAQVKESSRAFRDASHILEPFKQVLDLWTSRYFVDPRKNKSGINTTIRNLFLTGFFPDIKAGWFHEFKNDNLAERALIVARNKRFFHWELEFPDVFLESNLRESVKGFDAVIGNPPYDVLSEKELKIKLANFLDFLKSESDFDAAFRGKQNLYKLFICKQFNVTKESGYLGFIVPMALLALVS